VSIFDGIEHLQQRVQRDVLDRRATPFDVEAFCEDSMVRLHQHEQLENIRGVEPRKPERRGKPRFKYAP
jgi:hypothetical protein